MRDKLYMGHIFFLVTKFHTEVSKICLFKEIDYIKLPFLTSYSKQMQQSEFELFIPPLDAILLQETYKTNVRYQ